MGKTEKTFNRIAKYLTKVYNPKFDEVVQVSKKLQFCRTSISGYEVRFFDIVVKRPTTDYLVLALPLSIDFKEFNVSKLVKDIWTEIQNHVPVQNSPAKSPLLLELDRITCIHAIELCMTMYSGWAENNDAKETLSKLRNMSDESKNTSESVQSTR